MSAGPLPVPLPPSLPQVVLAYLVPAPNPPLPPELLSLSLLQRHQYLPPSLDDPIDHFLPSSTVTEDVKRSIADALDEVGRMMGEGEHPSLEPTYAFPDPLTLQARILLFANFDAPSLELLFNYEGPERAWRLEGLRLVADSNPTVRWCNLEEALEAGKVVAERLAQEHEVEEHKDEQAVTEDFWAGYDGEEPLKSPSTSKDALARVGSSASVNDDYWAQYGEVDDHVGPRSNGVSPKIDSFALPSTGRSSVHSSVGPTKRSVSKDAWSREAWGTGGETPVGWTPVLTPEVHIKDPRHHSSSSSACLPLHDLQRKSNHPSERYPFPSPNPEDEEDEGSYPVFPEPDFKGATPASVTPSTPPEAPSRLPLGHTRLAPSPPAAHWPTFVQPNQPPIKLTLPDFAAPLASASTPSSGPPTSALQCALTGIFEMHLASNPGQTREQASAEWLKVAIGVVAAQSGAVINLGEESPETASTPVGAVGPFGL